MSRSSADNSRTASANSTINLLCSSEYCSSSLKDEGGRGLDLTLRGENCRAHQKHPFVQTSRQINVSPEDSKAPSCANRPGCVPHAEKVAVLIEKAQHPFLPTGDNNFVQEAEQGHEKSRIRPEFQLRFHLTAQSYRRYF
jgi:hypothetical protein